MNVKRLVEDYMAAVEECLVLFERKFGRRDLMKAASEGLIAKSGALADGVEYDLHGIGCRVEFSEREVDFDFATPEGDVGFDAWRLLIFAERFPEQYPEYQEKASVERALADLVASGMVTPIGGHSNLLRLHEEA